MGIPECDPNGHASEACRSVISCRAAPCPDSARRNPHRGPRSAHRQNEWKRRRYSRHSGRCSGQGWGWIRTPQSLRVIFISTSETRNPIPEVRNKSEESKKKKPQVKIGLFHFLHSCLFRISCFDFRVFPASPSVLPHVIAIPPAEYAFLPGIEKHSFHSLDVQVAKKRVVPSAEAEKCHRSGHPHIYAEHATLDVSDEFLAGVPLVVKIDAPLPYSTLFMMLIASSKVCGRSIDSTGPKISSRKTLILG